MTDYTGATAIVIGGSIGGLTTALLLRDLGFTVDVYERTATALDGRGSGIVLQPDTVRWFTERSTQDLADLSTSTSYVQYLDRTGDLVYREKCTWTYTSWGTFYRALLADFGTEHYHYGEYACGFDQFDDARDGAVRQRQGGVRRPGGVRRRCHVGGARAVRRRRRPALLRLHRLAWHPPGPRPRREDARGPAGRHHLRLRPQLAHHHVSDSRRRRSRSRRPADELRLVPQRARRPRTHRDVHRQAGFPRLGVRAPRPGSGPLRRRDEAGRRRTAGTRGRRGGDRHRKALCAGGFRCPVRRGWPWAGSP